MVWVELIHSDDRTYLFLEGLGRGRLWLLGLKHQCPSCPGVRSSTDPESQGSQNMAGVARFSVLYYGIIMELVKKMSKYNVSERISVVKAYYSSNSSPIAAQRKFATEYKLKTIGPSVITIKNVIKKFKRTGSVDVSTLQQYLLFVCSTS
ncbi:hypothetical protein AVEN_42441-1 [Araneus ventricosus]|uniref:DUF4817 domain-containing protein n=1 Tax=Araneus ventricosus TaxID=182803 RepID=A0A4Y2N3Z6_ARAVE|nr:hypothetical protein AVEN_42441-1 [Araneus ventricosus]